MSSWCGIHDRPRKFKKYSPIICYNTLPAAKVSKSLYDEKRYKALMGEYVIDLIVPKREARTWKLKKDDLCRITVTEGSQVIRNLIFN